MCTDYIQSTNSFCAYVAPRSDFTLLWHPTAFTTTDSVTRFVPKKVSLRTVFLPQTYNQFAVIHEQSHFGLFQTALLTPFLSADFFFNWLLP